MNTCKCGLLKPEMSGFSGECPNETPEQKLQRVMEEDVTNKRHMKMLIEANIPAREAVKIVTGKYVS